MGCGPHQPTARATAKTNSQLQWNATSLIKSFGNTSKLDPKRNDLRTQESYTNDISTMMNPTQDTTKPSANSMDTKERETHKHPAPYIFKMLTGTFLALTFIFIIVGIKMKNKPREEANIGTVNQGHTAVNYITGAVNHEHTAVNHIAGAVNHGHIAVNHIAGAVNHGHPTVNLITPPTVNSLYQGTTDEEDPHYYNDDLAAMDESQTLAPTLNSTHQNTHEEFEGFNPEHLAVPENAQLCMGSASSGHSQATSRLYASSGVYTSGDAMPSSLYTSAEGNSANLSTSAEGLNYGDSVAHGTGELCSEPIYSTQSQTAAVTSSRLYTMCD